MTAKKDWVVPVILLTITSLAIVIVALLVYRFSQNPWASSELERAEQLVAEHAFVGLSDSAADVLMEKSGYREAWNEGALWSRFNQGEEELDALLASIPESITPAAYETFSLGMARTGLDDAYLMLIYDDSNTVLTAGIVIQ